MEWFSLILVALLYACLASLIGVTFSLHTGADVSSFEHIMFWSVAMGPVVVMVIVAMRGLARDTGFKVPIVRAIYHALLIAFAAPMFMHGASLIASARGDPTAVRSLDALKYWTIPCVFVSAVMWSILDMLRRGKRRRACRAPDSLGGPTDAGSSAD